MNEVKQPEALRLADALLMGNAMIPEIDLPEAAAELRRLHAYVQKLEPIPSRKILRHLVDVVWNECTESTTVPETRWADQMIDKAIKESLHKFNCIDCEDTGVNARNGYDCAYCYGVQELEGQQKREPLSIQQIHDAWYGCGIGTTYDITPSQDDIDWARAIERAHGIKEQP